MTTIRRLPPPPPSLACSTVLAASRELWADLPQTAAGSEPCRRWQTGPRCREPAGVREHHINIRLHDDYLIILCNILNILSIRCNTSPNHYYYHSITLQL